MSIECYDNTCQFHNSTSPDGPFCDEEECRKKNPVSKLYFEGIEVGKPDSPPIEGYCSLGRSKE
jgi:hypothetical protein